MMAGKKPGGAGIDGKRTKRILPVDGEDDGPPALVSEAEDRDGDDGSEDKNEMSKGGDATKAAARAHTWKLQKTAVTNAKWQKLAKEIQDFGTQAKNGSAPATSQAVNLADGDLLADELKVINRRYYCSAKNPLWANVIRRRPYWSRGAGF